nr:reverse transcriptase domain-containing protein [Tanacetum cinerariifolium]
SVPAGFTRSVPAGFTRSVPAKVTRSVPAGFTRSVPAEITRLAPIEGYEDAIVVPALTANNFELKHGLLTLVQNKQFFGHDKEDSHAHV